MTLYSTIYCLNLLKAILLGDVTQSKILILGNKNCFFPIIDSTRMDFQATLEVVRYIIY